MDETQGAANKEVTREASGSLPDEILPGLYLGDYESAKNRTGLLELGVTHVLIAAEGIDTWYPEVSDYRSLFAIVNLFPQDFTYISIPLYDTPTEVLLPHLDTSFEFIQEGRSKGGVLVHWYSSFLCGSNLIPFSPSHAGVSRSASFVLGVYSPLY